MASFSGTISEFVRYIGPFARNEVQTMTRAYKKTIGKCEGERCIATIKLEAAHVGRDRNEVIASVVKKLLGTVAESGVGFTLDLAAFKSEFRKEHVPFSRTIKILCPSCHKKQHDSRPKNENAMPANSGRAGTLTIVLVPADPSIFKREFLKSRNAEIEIAYIDGSTKKRPWRATRFSESSSIMNNLRSMPDFRNNKWQALAITKITVRVTPAP